MIEYNYKLKCPKCGSFNCQYNVEKIFNYTMKTKKDGWLRKKGRLGLICQGTSAEQITCLNCGYEEYPLQNQNNFFVDEKEVNV